MKPKKTTAPSNSQRDSQDLPVGGVSIGKHSTGKSDSQDLKDKFLKLYSDLGAKDFNGIVPVDLVVSLIQEEKGKSFQAGFQEAVKRIQEFLASDNCKTVFNDEKEIWGYHGYSTWDYLKSLKPTPDQEGDKDE